MQDNDGSIKLQQTSSKYMNLISETQRSTVPAKKFSHSPNLFVKESKRFCNLQLLLLIQLVFFYFALRIDNDLKLFGHEICKRGEVDKVQSYPKLF